MSQAKRPPTRIHDIPRGDRRILAEQVRFEDAAGFMMRVLENRGSERYYELTPRSDVTPRQISTLLALYRDGSLTQTQLAATIRVDRSTLSEMTNRMEERGYIVRSVDPNDRRATSMRISPAGEDVLFETLPAIIQAQQDILAPLPVLYRPVFIRCLQILYGAQPPEADLPAPAKPRLPRRAPRKAPAATGAGAARGERVPSGA